MSNETDEPKVKATKKEIEAIKQEIRELYHNYKTRRLEVGMKLLQLQELLADHDKGTFGTVTTEELKIPRATVYDLINFAKAEVARVLDELSESRTTDDDTLADVDFTGKGWARFLALAYPNGVPKRKPRDPNPYVRPNYMQFVFTRKTRLEVVASWKILKGHKTELKVLSKTIAKEIINAAAPFKKTSDK